MPYVVFAYDVRDDARRFRVARILRSSLERVQKSVFEGEIDDERLRVLEARARRHLNEREDSLRVYPFCARCAVAIRVCGTTPPLDDPEVFVV